MGTLIIIGVLLALGIIAINVMGEGNKTPKNRPWTGAKSKPRSKPGPRKYTSSSPGLGPTIPASRSIMGKCHVIDGDTIVIRKVQIRLAGIDAPELNEPFGQKSKWAMIHICKGQVVTATLNGETSYDRLVGTCTLTDGRDIGAELIKQGLAVDWGFFSGGKYRDLEPSGARYKLRRPPFNRYPNPSQRP